LSLGTIAVLDKRLTKMVAAGRLTEEEAKRMRAASTASEREEAARTVQMRHARSRLEEAVDSGRLTPAEAEAFVERLDRGEDVSILRGVRRRARKD